MNPDSWIALATVVASTIITALGLFFRYRERTIGFRQVLYGKQIEVAVAVVSAFATVRNRLVLLFDAQDEISKQDMIWQAVRPEIDALASLAALAGTVLPSRAYGAYENLHTVARSIMNEIAYNPMPVSELDRIDDAALSFINEVRGLLGVDSLSEENRVAFIGASTSSIGRIPAPMRDTAERPS